MDLEPRPLPFDPARLEGLSTALLASHHANNYTGAVRRLNAIRARLREAPPGALPPFALNGLKREELVATNSMLLHELYFDGLGEAGSEMAPAMALALAASFGSVARWRDEFMAMGRALGGGSGWVLLVFQPREGTLVNQWAADHAHALAGGVPVLALDMYEHAYHRDFGADAASYVDAFMRHVDWDRVYARYRQAVEAASEPFGATADDLPAATWCDVRREAVYLAGDGVIPGARWRDPATVADWASALPRDRPVVVYCVYGHEVGRATALRLRAAGLDARFLRGGIDGWVSGGRALAPRDA